MPQASSLLTGLLAERIDICFQHVPPRQRRCTMAHLHSIYMEKGCFDARFSLESMGLYLSFLGEDVANEMGLAILVGTVSDN
jgi:hypothetical protein